MCRNIWSLQTFDPPATSEEVHAAATDNLLGTLTRSAPPRHRELEAAKAQPRAKRTTPEDQ